MLPLSYSVLECDRKTKDVHGQVQFNINCSSFFIAIEVYKVFIFITSPSINYGQSELELFVRAIRFDERLALA